MCPNGSIEFQRISAIDFTTMLIVKRSLDIWTIWETAKSGWQQVEKETNGLMDNANISKNQWKPSI